jgi:hypothetical protein
MSETRKLAAILAADVVGYSRLMGEDEAGNNEENPRTRLVVRRSRRAAFTRRRGSRDSQPSAATSSSRRPALISLAAPDPLSHSQRTHHKLALGLE